MTVQTIHENDADELSLAGRTMRWLVADGALRSPSCSACVIHMRPGDKVTPAHPHPNGDEVIYIIQGAGRVLVDGDVRPVSAGTAVLFPKGSVHMLHNAGSEEMKVICFFAPPTGLDNYRLHEGIDFPD